jgi:hypothetical protein
VKFSFVPRDPGSDPAHDDHHDHLSRDIAARAAQRPLAFDFRIQAFVDEARTPIEDPTVEWTEAVAPWVTVGRLDIPVQDPASERGRKVAAYIETLSFDPWHAPAEFRPLGIVMRARAAAYRDSVIERKAAPEPDGTEVW